MTSKRLDLVQTRLERGVDRARIDYVRAYVAGVVDAADHEIGLEAQDDVNAELDAIRRRAAERICRPAVLERHKPVIERSVKSEAVSAPRLLFVGSDDIYLMVGEKRVRHRVKSGRAYAVVVDQ